MKICIDLTALADNLSGIERYAACLTKELLENSKEEFVLIFKEQIHSLFQQFTNNNNITCVVIPSCNKLAFNQIRLPLKLFSIKADWYLFLAFPVPIIFFKKNMVSTIHDICCWDCPETMKGAMSWYFRISHRIALKKCKSIITISEFSKKRIHERLKYPNEKIWLIYCGIDDNQFLVDNAKFEIIRAKYSLPNQYLLSLSTLEPRKNLHLLIQAYESLITEGSQLPPLVIAGRKGWKMDEILSNLDETVKDKIIFTGFVDDEDLPEVYAMADFFFFPSTYEGFGMPPLEAMACGTPTISSDASSLPEVLGEAAIYFESDDIKSLKNAIINSNLMSNEQYNRLVKLGLSRAKTFDWTKEAEKLYSLLNTRL